MNSASHGVSNKRQKVHFLCGCNNVQEREKRVQAQKRLKSLGLQIDFAKNPNLTSPQAPMATLLVILPLFKAAESSARAPHRIIIKRVHVGDGVDEAAVGSFALAALCACGGGGAREARIIAAHGAALGRGEQAYCGRVRGIQQWAKEVEIVTKKGGRRGES